MSTLRCTLNMVIDIEEFIISQGLLGTCPTVKALHRAQVALLKNAVHELQPNKLPIAKQPNNNLDGLTPEEAGYANQYDCKITAIKLVRDRTKMGLKEAKDLVDNYIAKRNGGLTSWSRPDDSPKW